MLSTAIVVFREIFEIAIIVSILMVATQGLSGRARWITMGILGGVLASALVASLVDVISRFAEGMGQEVFNACILFAASAMIGSTVVWMRKHGRELAQKAKSIGNGVAGGELPLYALTVATMLATLREGSEIVLFSYGALASGQAAWSVMAGGAIGVLAGAGVGAMLYFGLLNIPTRHLFSVTSWLLIFISAGLAAQGAGLLVQADKLPDLMPMVWDTSAFIPEQSMPGQVLHALVGYIAQPSGIQLLFYILTVALVAGWMYSALWLSAWDKKRMAVTPVVAAALVLATAHGAQAGHIVYAPYVEKGEFEVEYYGDYNFDDDNDVDGGTGQKVAIGYGVTDFWATELNGEFEREHEGEQVNFENVEWENRFQFTERGQYFLDVGGYLGLETSTSGHGPHKAEAKLLLAKDVGKWLHIANIGLEEEFGPGENETEGTFAWSTRYNLNEHFQPGFEVYSEIGEGNGGDEFNEQSHQAGPVFYGNIAEGFRYEIGYLFGLSDAAPDGTVRWLLEWEGRF